MSALTRAPARHLLAFTLAASVVAAAGLTGVAAASAAPVDATGGTLSWGMDAAYRGIFSSYRTATAPATVEADIPTYPLASGSYDETTRQGTLDFSGAVQLGYLIGPTVGVSQGNYFFLQDPSIAIDGDTATLSGITAGSSHDLNPDLPTTAKGLRTVATIDLGSVTPQVTDSSITWTAAPAAVTAEGAAVFAHFDTGQDAAPTKRAVGSALDPVTLTVQRTAVTAPDDPTTPPADPNDPADPPASDPGDPEADAATTAAIAVSPAAPVERGESTTITATVEASGAQPTGSVSFYDTPASGTRTLLATVPVSNGTAEHSVALSAGGHELSADFTGGTGFADSTAVLSTTGRNGAVTVTNYNVVDTAQPAVCAPSGTGLTTTKGVTASWDWSAYSSGWTKRATGDVSVDGKSFTLTNGTATSSAECTRVDFTGTLTAEAYATAFPPDGLWITLVDPSLTIDADGNGTWSAAIRAGEEELTTDGTGPRTVVATVSGASALDLTAAGSASVALDYANTTAKGTWTAGYSDAWSNAFIMQVPGAIRAFYYTSGTTAAQATKPPSPVELAWKGASVPVTPPGTDPTTPADPAPPATEPGSGTGNLAWGFKESWRAYVGGVAAGTTTTSRGATIAADGRFLFPQGDKGDFDPATRLGTIDYTGGVLFTSAAHGFSLGFADPQITFDADGSTRLTALVSKSDTAGLGSTSRIVLATLSTEALVPSPRAAFTALAAPTSTVVWTDVPATFASSLQPDGWSRYASTAADPVTFGFGTAAVAPGGGTTTGDGSGDGTSDPNVGTIVAAGSQDASDAQPQCTARSVSGASLSWGVKASFRSYVTGSIAKGDIALDGVSTSGGDYAWSGGTGSVNTEDTLGRVGWKGGVVFTGHAGMLDLRLSNPSIRLSGPTTATLYADVSSKALSGPDVHLTGAAIATLDLAAGTSTTTSSAVGYTGVPASLTATGASAFAGNYSAGQQLDPVSFSLPLGAAVACDSTTDASLAFTGSNGTGELMAGAAILVLLGLAAVLIRRRRSTDA